MRKSRGNLERTHNAATRDLGRFFVRNILLIEQNLPAGRDQKLGQQIEKSGLARAIRTDQGMDSATAYLQINLIDGDKTFELFHQFSGFQNNCIGHRLVHCLTLLTAKDLRL